MQPFDIKEYAEDLIEDAPVPLLIISKAGTIVSCNESLCELTGYFMDELINSTLHKLLPIRIRNEHDRLIQLFFKQPRNRKMGDSTSKVSLMNSNQEEISVNILLKTVNGSGQFVAAYIIDTSRINKLLEEKEKMTAGMQELIEKLEAENEGIRGYNLEMEKLKAGNNLQMEELKANNSLKMHSLLIVMGVVFVLNLTPMFKQVPAETRTAVGVISGTLIGTFLTKLLSQESS